MSQQGDLAPKPFTFTNVSMLPVRLLIGDRERSKAERAIDLEPGGTAHVDRDIVGFYTTPASA